MSPDDQQVCFDCNEPEDECKCYIEQRTALGWAIILLTALIVVLSL